MTEIKTYHSMIKVLIIEDEPDLQEALIAFLNMEGFVADGVGSLQAAELWMQTHDLDVLLLDLGLPDGDGLSWLKGRFELQHKGVIITTARGSNADRLAGAQAGADVYLVKPIFPEEIASLINNLVRRIRPVATATWKLDPIQWNLISPEGIAIKLTHSEHVILHRLMLSAGKPVRRDALIKELGHDPVYYDSRRLEILIRRLRNKAKVHCSEDMPLETVHGLGYAFTAAFVST